MAANTIRERWAAGEAAVDCWVSGSSVLSTEVIGRLGYDSIVIDMQHTMAEYRDVVTSIIALAASPTMPLVRVPGNDPVLVGRVLDAGARGVMCPMINTREEAERFVRAARYAPDGTRSYGPYRAADGARYFEEANADIVTFAQIETLQALANIDEIAATPGLDVLFVGPTDLSISGGGKPSMSYTDPLVDERHRAIVTAAHNAGKRAGMLALAPGDPEIGRGWGMDFLSVAMEQRLVAVGAAQALRAGREVAGTRLQTV
ncbi:MAG: aldolase/citrate lyase family protein [Pseudonocardia sp.]|nr:aldolase/citrate lyase family protein [Pseudonocardia sp.]